MNRLQASGLFTLGDNTVEAAQIKDLAIKEADLGVGIVSSGKIGTGAVVTTSLGTLAVTESKIANGSIFSGKIGTGGVVASNILAGTITPDKLANQNFTFSGNLQIGQVGVAYKGLILIDEGSTAFNKMYTVTVSGGALKIS
jgi:hypothetical protein